MNKLKHLDLCSGIGGFSLGLESTGGFETIGFSEIEIYRCAVLKKHWPKVKNYGDIGNVRRVKCDIITGGFPCPPFSFAGKRKGAEDDRHIWPTMFGVIALNRPAWCICENVPGIIDMELDNCVADLEDIGYEVQPIIIPACAVDAKHRRDRVWIIAYRNESDGSAEFRKQQGKRSKITYCSRALNANIEEKRLERCDSKGNLCAIRQFGEFRQTVSYDGQIARKTPRSDKNKIRPTKMFISGDSEVNGHAAQIGRFKRDTNGGRNSERTVKKKKRTGFTDASWWPPEPGLGRMVYGIPARSHESKTVEKRLEALGDTILPQIAQILGEIILQTYAI